MTKAALLAKLRRLVGKMHEEGAISWPQVQMIIRTVHLNDLKVADICVPRGEIEAVEVGTDADEVRRRFRESGVSRLPVFEGTLDRIVGIVYARDWINFDTNGGYDLRSMCRPAVMVSETLPILDAMNVMRHKRVSIGICVDEHNGTKGLLTIEDIIEEVFDEIEDEYDIDEPYILRETEDEVVLDAAMPLDEFCGRFGLDIPNVPVETVGGLVSQETGHIQRNGETATTSLGRFTVLQADGRRLRRLRWHRRG